MTDLSDKLSAYLDGELTDPEAQQIEDWLAQDPSAQAQLETLMEADLMARDVFDAQMSAPVPLALAQTIKTAPMPASAPARRPIWGSIAAGLVLVMLGGAGGYLIGGATAPVQTAQAAGWLQDIADYHAVYATQKRHLVEVGADEADHIEAWLGATIGASFTIPDLSAHGLRFEGGRLLVANGAPVAQLMYRAPDDTVIALCLQHNERATEGFRQQMINGFDFVSWGKGSTNHVIIGPAGREGLDEIAADAARMI